MSSFNFVLFPPTNVTSWSPSCKADYAKHSLNFFFS